MSQVLTRQTPSLSAGETTRAPQSAWPLLWILLSGAAVRLVLLFGFPGGSLNIWDERDYNDLARNLVIHRQFAFTWMDASTGVYAVSVLGHPGGAIAAAAALTGEHVNGALPLGQRTSLRPPLYPAFVAAIYSLFGLENYQAVRAVQLVLSLLTVVLLYYLGSEIYDRRVGLVLSGLYCFYPSMLVYNQLLLTEVLFTFLLCAACLCVVRCFRRDSAGYLVLGGALIGLAALTRSVLWLFPLLLAVFVLIAWRANFGRRALAVVGMLAAFTAVIAPWAVRNTRLQQTFVAVDVMGGRNFMAGNYEHTFLHRAWSFRDTSDALSWEQVLLAADPTVSQMTQGEKDKRALRYGLEFVRQNPGLTLRRDIVKFFHFWGLERELLVGTTDGWWSRLSAPAALVFSLAVVGGYVLAMLLGVFGMVMAPPSDRRVHLFLILVITFVCGMHTLVFGHSRYHLPLLPLVLVYSASALVHFRDIWQRRRQGRFWLAAGIAGVFVLGWLWEILFVDGERILNAIHSVT